MKKIRTTIAFPVNLHESIRQTAIKEKKSMNDIVIDMIKQVHQQPKINRQLKQSRLFLQSFAAKYAKGYNPEEVVRSERDEHV